MDPQQLTIMAHKFQSVLDAEPLNERGHQLGFAKRQRLMTPFRFGLSVIASMATQQVPSMASLHRDFVTAQAYQEVIIPWCKTDKNRAQ